MNLQVAFLRVNKIRGLGVARFSIGPELWRTAMKTFTERAEVSAL